MQSEPTADAKGETQQELNDGTTTSADDGELDSSDVPANGTEVPVDGGDVGGPMLSEGVGELICLDSPNDEEDQRAWLCREGEAIRAGQCAQGEITCGSTHYDQQRCCLEGYYCYGGRCKLNGSTSIGGDDPYVD